MGHLRYDDNSGLNEEAMVGIAVGCSLQILIIAIIIVAAVYTVENNNFKDKTIIPDK